MSQTTAPLRDEPIRDEPLRAESRDLVPAPGRGLVPASRPVGSPQPGLAGAGASIIAWGEIVLLGFLAIVGAFFASANAGPGDYGCIKVGTPHAWRNAGHVRWAPVKMDHYPWVPKPDPPDEQPAPPTTLTSLIEKVAVE